MLTYDQTFESENIAILASVTALRAVPESFLELLAREGECRDLRTGDVLFEEGDADDAIYIVLSGALEMVGARSGRPRRVLASFVAGDCIGETVVLFHRPRQATVSATKRSEVLKLSLPLLGKLFERYPSVHNDFRRLASRTLLSFNLASSSLLAEVDIDSLRMLEGEANWLQVAGGETLFREGDPPDYLYVVACGRLEVTVNRDGKQEVIAHIGRGGSVGEMDLLTGEPRSTTVRATRDTQLVRLSKEQFESLVLQHPQCMTRIAKTLATTVRQNGTAASKPRIATIALIPLQADGLPVGFVERLLDELSPLAGPAFNLSSRRINSDLGKGACSADDDTSHTRLINWLAEYEDKFPCLLLECDPRLSSWTALCLRHADLILLVSRSNAEPSIGPVEAAIVSGQMSTSSSRKELVIVHSDAATLPAGTSERLASRRVDAHHHVRSGRRSDYQRLARLILGKAVGVVLSGGGARGLAHIGALRALEECGVPVDLIGGTSIGAAVAGKYATGVDIPTLVEMGNDFSNHFGRRLLRDLTFPTVAFHSGQSLSAYVKQWFGDTAIEDLWLSYFCTSSNLTKAELTVHDRGSLWAFIRASCSVPGLWPPMIQEGQMLVDGGVMNNLPVDVMRARCSGPVIAIDISPDNGLTGQSGPHAKSSASPSLWKHLNPFADKSELPHIFNILQRTSQLGSISAGEATKQKADLYLQPPTANVDFFNWKGAQKLVDVAYEHCRNKIEEWKR